MTQKRRNRSEGSEISRLSGDEGELENSQPQIQRRRRIRQPPQQPRTPSRTETPRRSASTGSSLAKPIPLRRTSQKPASRQRVMPGDSSSPATNRSENPSQIKRFPTSNNSQNRRRPPSPTTKIVAENGAINNVRRLKNGSAISNQESATDKRSGLRNSPTATNKVRRSRSRPFSPLLYCARMVILGVGIGAIAGTILSILDPANRHLTAVPPTQESKTNAVGSGSLKLSQEILPLKTSIQKLAAQNPKLQPGIFLVDLDTGAYVDCDGNSTFAAASTIKVPILVAFFQDVDAGKIRLDEKLTLQPEMIASGSGDMQFQKPGMQFTALETVTKMIAISDNSATNMIVARLGGAESLNQRFQSWGIKATQIKNPLPDLEGTNSSSPKDMATLMAMVNQGELVSVRSRDRLLNIMQRTVTNTLLPKGLGEGANIAHKTGDIGTLIADVGLIDMPTGKRYIAVAMVKRPQNDPRAQELIRQISRLAYQHFSQSATIPTSPATPSATSAPFIRSKV